ncbi:MAG: site-specific integrase, partial [Verrucomicrobia bacterium]|nr:site-specific integrase [Verrucomicrobiota bacterium]
MKDLLAVAENQWRGMILLGYHTGIRLSDAANLTWANVDL